MTKTSNGNQLKSEPKRWPKGDQVLLKSNASHIQFPFPLNFLCFPHFPDTKTPILIHPARIPPKKAIIRNSFQEAKIKSSAIAVGIKHIRKMVVSSPNCMVALPFGTGSHESHNPFSQIRTTNNFRHPDNSTPKLNTRHNCSRFWNPRLNHNSDA